MNNQPEEPAGWLELARYASNGAAEVDAALLRGQGVAATVVSTFDPVVGQSIARLLVAPSLRHRARWLLAAVEAAPLGDAELEYLATGQLPGPDHHQ